MSLADAASCYSAQLEVEFASAAHASLAARALDVDAELQASKAWRSLVADGALLRVTLRATELRVLRVVVASMFDRVAIVARTLRDHAEPAASGGGGGGGSAP
jgi:EKC/KEOPS complex subunit PCC1/LAGE3